MASGATGSGNEVFGIVQGEDGAEDGDGAERELASQEVGVNQPTLKGPMSPSLFALASAIAP